MRKLVLLVVPFTLLGLVPAMAVSADAGDKTTVPSAVTAVSGTPTSGEMAISGSAVFGGQRPVEVADDPGNDAQVTPNVGDFNGTGEHGIDLIGADISVPDPDTPQLLVQWQLAGIPPSGQIPEATRLTFPFKAGEAVYQVQAKFSNLATDPQGGSGHIDGAYELLGNCMPNFMGTGSASCQHLAWLTGSVDTVYSTVSVSVPMGSPAAPQLVPGAVLERNNATSDDLNLIMAGVQLGFVGAANDTASFGDPSSASYAFTIPTKQVTLGIGPTGTDPSGVDFSTPATLAGDGSFSGSISTAGFAPGSFDVFAKACFGANCGIRSLGGVTRVDDGLVATLRLTDRASDSYVFWAGGKVGDQLPYANNLPNNANIQSCDNTPCFDYKLRVDTPGAARLRIAIDVPARSDGFAFRVTPPSGPAHTDATNPTAFNREDFTANPPVGVYDILVHPYSVHAPTRFQMRAKLEAQIPVFAPDASGRLLPDLQPTPPYDLGFAAPVNPLNGPFFAPDSANPPADVAGVHPASCSPDETFGDNTTQELISDGPDPDSPHTRCLRFSFGLSNVGHGQFDAYWNGNATTAGPGPAFQCVERPGETPAFETRPAGEMVWHETHAHLHVKDIVKLELFKVTDATAGTLASSGVGRKIGYFPANESFGNWYSFDQRTDSSKVAGCGLSGSQSMVGLSGGWGDVYRWQRVGNYVNFAANGDGRYVVRLTADPKNNILETTDGNNASYTYFEVTGTATRVTGEHFTILEQGRGSSPWDPNKVVLHPRIQGGVPW
ncbi:MAG: hypothetical protein ABR600_13880 [Actinomycetota bacterium]